MGPAKYESASPKYVRAEEEEEEEDDDVEAPYLAPRDRARAKDYPEDGPLTSSSESIPALIDLDEEIPPHPTNTPSRSRNAVCPATLGLAKDKKATAVLVENFPPSPLSLDKENPGKGAPLRQPRKDQWQRRKSQKKASYTLMMTWNPPH